MTARKYCRYEYSNILSPVLIQKNFEIDSSSVCQNTNFKKPSSDAGRGVDCKLHLKKLRCIKLLTGNYNKYIINCVYFEQ